MARNETHHEKTEIIVHVGDENQTAQTMVASHMGEIDRLYGDDLPYNKGAIIQQTRYLLASASDAMLQAGRNLIQLKEHEGHGGFLDAVDQIGIHPRAAQRLMTVAVKLSNTSALSHLKNPSRAKMIELATLDDTEIKELDEGGTVRGLKLDDIDRMSVRELQHALRKTRDDLSKKDQVSQRVLEQKNATIDKLQNEMAELETLAKAPPDWDQSARQLETDVTIEAGFALQQFDKLALLRDRIQEYAQQCSEAQSRSMAQTYLAKIEQLIAELNALATVAHEEFAGIVANGQEADYRLSDLPLVHDLIEG